MRPNVRPAYFDALELLRSHLSRCLGQVAAVEGMDAPKECLIAPYQEFWQVEGDVALAFPENG